MLYVGDVSPWHGMEIRSTPKQKSAKMMNDDVIGLVSQASPRHHQINNQSTMILKKIHITS